MVDAGNSNANAAPARSLLHFIDVFFSVFVMYKDMNTFAKVIKINLKGGLHGIENGCCSLE